MGVFDKIFGLALVGAGIAIALYWTAWQLLSLVSIHNFLISIAH